MPPQKKSNSPSVPVNQLLKNNLCLIWLLREIVFCTQDWRGRGNSSFRVWSPFRRRPFDGGGQSESLLPEKNGHRQEKSQHAAFPFQVTGIYIFCKLKISYHSFPSTAQIKIPKDNATSVCLCGLKSARRMMEDRQTGRRTHTPSPFLFSLGEVAARA